MYKDLIKNAEDKMVKSQEALKRELQSLRAGRANPQILDRIMVDYYGVQTPLKQMANIAAPEPRMLTISVWDIKAIPQVEKAILQSDLGLNPANDGKIIRLVIPELNEERRKELTKIVKKNAEEARIAVRNARRDAIDRIKKMEKDSEISEDERFRAEEEIQKVTDQAIKDVDAIADEKEKEIMEV
ncbi:MAG: ribosome recycling factor [Eubacteriales bacterium]|nr:ribosome recycling factor [Eubacteriales bacterium]